MMKTLRAILILLTLGLLVHAGAEAQISPTTAATAGSTVTYTYSGVAVSNPVWQISNGTKGASSSTYVTVTWGTTATSGTIVLLDGTTFRASASISIKPSTPTGLTATAISPTSFTASWTAVGNASGYYLDVSTSSSFTSFVGVYNNLSVSTTSTTVSGLIPYTVYYFRVRATNSSGTSASSSNGNAKTSLAPPVISITTGINGTTFIANWEPSTGATSYRLDVSTVSNFASFVSGYSNLTVSATTKTVGSLTANTQYYFRVRAANGSDVSASSTTGIVTTGNYAPSTVAASGFTETSFNANWSPVSGATSYQLDVSSSPTFSSFVSGYSSLPVTGTSKVVSGLAGGTTYYYRLRTVNSSGVSVEGSSSSGLTKPAPPATITLTAQSTSVNASWTTQGATGYFIDVAKDAAFTNFVAGYNNKSVATASTTVTGLLSSTPYYLRVRASNASGTSVSSSAANITTQQKYASLNENFIVSNTIQVDNITSTDGLDALPPESVAQSIQYFDGLGRPKQAIAVQGSPQKNDIVTPFQYEANGLEKFRYMPYVPGQSTGYLVTNPVGSGGAYPASAHYAYYQNGTTDLVADDKRPFSETTYEASPLKRVLKQFNPGNDWYVNNKSVDAQSLVNVDGTLTGQEKVIKWNVVSDLPARDGANAGHYPSGKLSISVTTDEEGAIIRDYTDPDGRMILRKRYLSGAATDLNNVNNWSQIYYIYDDYGRLRFVLQPVLVSQLITSGLSPSQTDLDQLAFQYKYDERGRMTAKTVPGALPIYMVYDERDRVVLTQDGNQRNYPAGSKEWTFIKYDVMNRPVLTGKYLNDGTLDVVQSAVNSFYATMTSSKAWFESYLGTSGIVLGYDNKSFPQVSTLNSYYTATYYDAYDSYNAPAAYNYDNTHLSGLDAAKNQYVKSLVVAVYVRNLATDSWMRTVNYYNAKYKLIQSISDHQKGSVRVSTLVDFVGKPVSTKRSYVVNGTSGPAVQENYTYDHAGRLLNVKQSINGSPTYVTISKNEYNELGQLVDKKLHSTDDVNFKQSVDHRYNIRGWLTNINEADVSIAASGDAGVDYFGMELAYNTSFTDLALTKAYSGNVAGLRWSKGNGGIVRKQTYAYTYDKMNRLLNADHYDYELQNDVLGWQINKKGFSEKLSYDMNGNIKSLVRKGFKGMSMDSLIYGYTGNVLNYVHDYGDATKGFVNGYTGTDDYSYDFNGNLDKDKNKGLVNKGNIKYNFMNLPIEIIKGTEKVKYIYDASGRKLAQEVYNSSGTLAKRTDYIGELVYEDDALKIINHGEGRILPDGSGWEYQYHLKDHLGNVRVTFTTKAQTPSSVTANFETATNTNFQNYQYISTFDLVDHTDAGTVYQKTQKLYGANRAGLAKSVAVMPGDEITMSAWGKYMNLGSTNNANAFLTSLASAFGTSAAATGEQLKLYNGLSSYASTVAGGQHDNGVDDDESAPKLFVTIIFFDKDYNFIDAAWKQITTNGEQTSGSVKQPHDFMSITAKAPEAGYAYAFVSNEHPTLVEAYFDDVTFTHTSSPIVSVSDYFPYGLSYNQGERAGATEQKYLYNGKELQDELSLNWYDYGARMYMSDIGRWGVVDPMSEKLRRWSPYSYAVDNPVRFIDPDGMLSLDALGGDTRSYEEKAAEAQERADKWGKKAHEKKKNAKSNSTSSSRELTEKEILGLLRPGVNKDGYNIPGSKYSKLKLLKTLGRESKSRTLIASGEAIVKAINGAKGSEFDQLKKQVSEINKIDNIQIELEKLTITLDKGVEDIGLKGKGKLGTIKISNGASIDFSNMSIDSKVVDFKGKSHSVTEVNGEIRVQGFSVFNISPSTITFDNEIIKNKGDNGPWYGYETSVDMGFMLIPLQYLDHTQLNE